MKAIIALPLLLLLALTAACMLPEATPPPPTDIPEVIPTPRIADTPTPAVIGTPTPETSESQSGRVIREYSQPPEMTIDPEGSYSAEIRTNQGAISVELYAEDAPVTVNNFVFLARQGFYDGVIFHRVIPDFMIQGGDPTGTGGGDPGYKFDDEIVPSQTFDGPGILAMANAGKDPAGRGTNGSQFFITVAATPHLTGNHTIFGRVTAGQEVADAISKVPTSRGNRPREEVVIQSIEIKEGE